MGELKYISITSNRNQVVLKTDSVIYVEMQGKVAQIHIYDGKIYKTRMTLTKLRSLLGDNFIQIHKGCIVSAIAIHDITDKIELLNGDGLEYTKRKKKQIIEQFRLIQKHYVNSLSDNSVPSTKEEYREYYRVFDNLPFAFTDIEMVFDEEKHAVDWIFRYGNSALAELEKIYLEKLIGSSFKSLFDNMDSKWLRCYERATLYGEVLEVIDYSPEIDTNLKIICFPTFSGHCGCILFNIENIELIQNSADAPKALGYYLKNAKEIKDFL
ncbi:MAG: LytTR family transcriptional regulator DNA-binding domain-containing protein [Acutalibacteraceae bacterium]